MANYDEQFRDLVDIATQHPERSPIVWADIQALVGKMKNELADMAANKETALQQELRVAEKESKLDSQLAAPQSMSSDLAQLRISVGDNQDAIKQVQEGIKASNENQATVLTDLGLETGSASADT